MRLDRYHRATDFLADAGAWLTEREAEHNLLLGIAGNLARSERAGEPAEDPTPYFAVVREGGRPVAAAMRTPPWNLVLSEVDDLAALGLLADDLGDATLPGVTGPPAAVRAFASAWTGSHGGRVETRMEERIYRLSEVAPPPRPARGAPREAAVEDRPLLLEWVVAFHTEALPGEDHARVRAMVEEWEPGTARRFWLWEDDGRPVCLVGIGSPTPNGIRVGPVYTPPAHRGRGYASALTAHASRVALAEGRSFCFLYTDVTNATANRIYQAIGYRPVTDALMVAFRT
jgi:predicted GNAT family acetyltransferase